MDIISQLSGNSIPGECIWKYYSKGVYQEVISLGNASCNTVPSNHISRHTPLKVLFMHSMSSIIIPATGEYQDDTPMQCKEFKSTFHWQWDITVVLARSISTSSFNIWSEKVFYSGPVNFEGCAESKQKRAAHSFPGWLGELRGKVGQGVEQHHMYHCNPQVPIGTRKYLTVPTHTKEYPKVPNSTQLQGKVVWQF